MPTTTTATATTAAAVAIATTAIITRVSIFATNNLKDKAVVAVAAIVSPLVIN